MGLYRIAPQFTHYKQQASKMTDTVTIPRSEYEMIYKMIGERLGAPIDAVPTPSKVSKKAEKAEKKPRANTGVPTAWSEWTELMNKEHQAEIASYIVQRVASAEAGTLVYTADQNAVKLGRAVAGQPVPVKKAKIGAHLSWLKAYKAEHEADWLAFQAKWQAEHPKSATASVAEPSEDEGGEEEEAKPAKKRGAKKYADMTPEELAAAKAKRASKKASKDAVEAVEREASVMAPVEEAEVAESQESEEAEEVEDSLLPFTYKKLKCLRFGHKDADGEEVWDEGCDLWTQNPDGSKGAYIGILLATGLLDNRPEVLNNEPIV
jgi:hypothetical protein